MQTRIQKFTLLAFLAFCFYSFSSPAGAEESVCPFSCEDSRILSLQQPPMQGHDVGELQGILSALGFYEGTPNNTFDTETQRAVKDFQTSVNVTPDGIVTASIWQKLSRAVEPTWQELKAPDTTNLAILIDTDQCQLTVFADNKPYHSFPVALGKTETPSPIGTWKVIRKAKNWGTGFGTRWLGLNVPWGIYGIHGTNKPYSIGGYQSHGCIRMFNSQVEELYTWIPVGTPVIIVGNPFTYHDTPYKTLRQGSRGAMVQEVQSTLQRLGYPIQADGIWGAEMEQAVLQYRKDTGLSPDNAVDYACYQALGLK